MTLDLRDPAYRQNPYPTLKKLRDEGPVCRVEPYGYWGLTRYDDVLKVLKDPKHFASSGVSETFVPIRGAEVLAESRSLLGFDPPEHTRIRALVNKAFTSSTVAALAPRIRSLAEELIREIEAKQAPFDLVRDFSMPLPVTVIAELLGVSPDKKEDFKRWSDVLVSWRNIHLIPDEGERRRREQYVVRNTEEMLAYFHQIVSKRREEPRADLISGLVEACDAGQKLTAVQVLDLVRLLLVAGNETTTNLIGAGVLALIAHPDQWEKVKRDRTLIPNLVEETLRFDGPVLSVLRRAEEETEIAGHSVRAGDILMPLVASANHDERKFPDPERFEVTRETQGHVAFGAGIHFCVGAPLARLEARIAFEEIFDAFDRLARSDTSALDFVDSSLLRGVRRLTLEPPLA